MTHSDNGGATAGPPSFWRKFAFDYRFAIPALLLFFQGALWNYDTPGVYMDAVNPDYMALRLFDHAKLVPVWTLPGQMLFGKFPILVQIYHGALPYYLGLPIYLIFGTGVFGIRLANLLFGLLVVAGAAFALRAFRVRPWIAGTALAALALDPGFLLDFRSQFYINTLPLAFVFLAVGLVEREAPQPTARTVRLAGIFAGVSIYGYFIFLFLLPALVLHLWRRVEPGARRARLRDFAVGLVIGLSPYVLGFALMVAATGGPIAFVRSLIEMLGALQVARATLSPGERIAYAANMIYLTTLAVGPTTMLLRGLPLYLPHLKQALLLGAPILAFLINLVIRRRREAVLFAGVAVLGLAFLFLVFGNRAWLHHAAPALPLLYFALAAGVDQLVAATGFRIVAALGILALGLLGFANAVDRQHAMLALERTGGVGLASDAMTRFADDSLHDSRRTHAFFPDWGIFMPFAMETGGSIGIDTDFTPEAARQHLCAGQDVLLATIDATQAKTPERIPGWLDAVAWSDPEIRRYSQRDGAPVMTAYRWRAAATPAKPCPH